MPTIMVRCDKCGNLAEIDAIHRGKNAAATCARTFASLHRVPRPPFLHAGGDRHGIHYCPLSAVPESVEG